MNFDDMHELGWIDKNKPLWWSLDYSVDPREYIGFDEFQKRVLKIDYNTEQGRKGHFFLYDGDKVPVTTLEIELWGEQTEFDFIESDTKLGLFVTARPYSEFETRELTKYSDIMNFAAALRGGPIYDFDSIWPLENLENYINKTSVMPLRKHFFPHVRGIVKEERGNHIFWYPIQHRDLHYAIFKSIKETDFLDIWIYPIHNYYTESGCHWTTKMGAETTSRESPNHMTLLQELRKKKLVTGRRWIDHDTSGFNNVAYDRFVDGFDDTDMITVYPVRHPDVDETISLVLATRTHSESKKRGPTVLGVMSTRSYGSKYGIWRIGNKEFAEDISRTLSDDLGIGFDAVYFEGKYRLVGPNNRKSAPPLEKLILETELEDVRPVHEQLSLGLNTETCEAIPPKLVSNEYDIEF